MQKFWLLSLIWISIAGLFFGWIRQANAEGEQEALRLLNTVKPYMGADTRITFKYTGYYGSCEGSDELLLQTGRKLSPSFGVPLTDVLSEANGHPIYTVKKELETGIEVTLTLVRPQGQTACYMVLRLDASGQPAQAGLLKWQQQASEQLMKLGIHGAWNVMTQGYTSIEEASRLYSTNEWVSQLAQAFKGKIVDSYRDAKTISVSLSSDEFQTSIMSGNHKVNVQIALHQESTTGLWRLTVGTPIITMEY
ncbi:YwmB family TATA-box binding protein [Paenibacillus sp. N3.4]|uniref:YwmB family TATA-box binding protein n=1 Tax=Paenibacillus sp. N3.4 TaxID=2603222 RepID=UPI0011CB53A4|nr:YwmB family TATA-box binding protein [Paenibacillus sp. N3.4]TXK76736.1 hypothetical protein FU659_25025 [Paenibacillus sp. N3.4]